MVGRSSSTIRFPCHSAGTQWCIELQIQFAPACTDVGLAACLQVSDAVTKPTRSITHKAQTAMSYLGSHISEALHILHDPKVWCVLPCIPVHA